MLKVPTECDPARRIPSVVLSSSLVCSTCIVSRDGAHHATLTHPQIVSNLRPEILSTSVPGLTEYTAWNKGGFNKYLQKARIKEWKKEGKEGRRRQKHEHSVHFYFYSPLRFPGHR